MAHLIFFTDSFDRCFVGFDHKDGNRLFRVVDFTPFSKKKEIIRYVAVCNKGFVSIDNNLVAVWRKFCPHPSCIGAGSDATGMRTKFTPDGNEIVIDGNKTFITNGDVADYLLLFGKWSEIDDPKKSISVLVVETNEAPVETISKENKMGHRASSTATLAFDGVRVPRVNLIHNPGDGLKLLLASLNKSRPSVAAQALGIARAAFDEAVSYINERQQSGRKIIEFQGIQFLLADLATELAMCEAFLNHVARLIDSGAPDFSTEASMVKMRASDLAMRMARSEARILTIEASVEKSGAPLSIKRAT